MLIDAAMVNSGIVALWFRFGFVFTCRLHRMAAAPADSSSIQDLSTFGHPSCLLRISAIVDCTARTFAGVLSHPDVAEEAPDTEE